MLDNERTVIDCLKKSKPLMEFFASCNKAIRITVLGKTGNMKSVTGSSILGTRTFKIRGDVTICVMDTPGLFDTDIGKTVDDTLHDITRVIIQSSEDVYLFVSLCLSGAGFIKEERGTIDVVKKMLGNERKRILSWTIIGYLKKSNLLMEFSASCNKAIRIALLSKAGNGKSVTGSSILGTGTFKTLGDANICVMDTPGLFDTDTDKTVDDTLHDITRVITQSSEEIYLFVILCLSGAGFIKEERGTIDAIKIKLAMEKWEKSILVKVEGIDKEELKTSDEEASLMQSAFAQVLHVPISLEAKFGENLNRILHDVTVPASLPENQLPDPANSPGLPPIKQPTVPPAEQLVLPLDDRIIIPLACPPDKPSANTPVVQWVNQPSVQDAKEGNEAGPHGFTDKQHSSIPKKQQILIMETLTEFTRKFKTTFKGSAWLWLLTFLCVRCRVFAEHPCESPQYLELGTMGMINCSFPDNYVVISWFNSPAYWNHPLISLRNSAKEGRGYLSGEFDMLPNGSLVIKNVSLEHEHTFAVVRVDNPGDEVIPHYIDVVPVVLPQQKYPRITNCSELSPGICYAQYHEGSVFECSVDNSRPAVNLTWAVRIGSEEENKAHGLVVEHGPVSTSRAVLTDPFIPMMSITLAVCRATSQPDVLNENSVFLFLQKTDAHLSSSIAVKKYVVQASTAILNCPILTGEQLLVWNLKKSTALNQGMIVLAVFGTTNFTSVPVSGEYSLGDDGSLVINNASNTHQGTYSCITSNAGHEEARIYDIQVYSPAYPEVEGCSPNVYCVLDAEEYDSLNCTIRGVPRDVRLEFRAKTPGITFMHPTTTIYEAGGYYDVSLSARHKTAYSASPIVTIECGVTGTKTELFSDTAVLSLYVDSATDVPPTKRPGECNPWIVIMVGVAVICVCFAVLSLQFALRTHSKASRKPTTVNAECGSMDLTDSMKVKCSSAECRLLEPATTNKEGKEEEDKSISGDSFKF